MTEYVVQRLEEQSPPEAQVWVDVASVTVPPKTKRGTVIRRAAESAGIDGKATLRVIPGEHARPASVEWEQPPPRLKIG